MSGILGEVLQAAGKHYQNGLNHLSRPFAQKHSRRDLGDMVFAGTTTAYAALKGTELLTGCGSIPDESAQVNFQQYVDKEIGFGISTHVKHLHLVGGVKPLTIYKYEGHDLKLGDKGYISEANDGFANQIIEPVTYQVQEWQGTQYIGIPRPDANPGDTEPNALKDSTIATFYEIKQSPMQWDTEDTGINQDQKVIEKALPSGYKSSTDNKTVFDVSGASFATDSWSDGHPPKHGAFFISLAKVNDSLTNPSTSQRAGNFLAQRLKMKNEARQQKKPGIFVQATRRIARG